MPRLFYSLFLIILALGALSAPSFAQSSPDAFAEQYDKAASEYQRGNIQNAGKLWGELANQGDANSQYAMAIMHLKKEIPQSSEKTAFTYLSSASKQQHLAAMFNLGVAYWEGKGTPKQAAKALNWWEIAAQRQDAGAQYNLGLAYYIGEGREQDNNKAIYWLNQAADNHHPQAQSLLVDIQADLPEKPVQTTSVIKTRPVLSPPAKKVAATKVVRTVKTSKTPTKKSSLKLSKGSTQSIISISALRAKPSPTAALVSTLKPGDRVNILQSSGGWSKVIAPRSYAVWVFNTFLKDQGNGLGTIRGNNVNIRPLPNTNNVSSPPLGALNDGVKVAVILKRNGWTQIIPSKPFPAWVSNSAFGQ